MKLENLTEFYELMVSGMENIPSRKQAILLRKAGFEACASGNGFKKLGFDTRRIDQETQFNPRRGLQNYNRSDAFISKAMSIKLGALKKLHTALEELQHMFGKQHQWQDSNARVLLSTLDKGLRTGIEDGDYAVSQPSQGSLDYIEELLHVRYRLNLENINKLASDDLKVIILSKDEELLQRDVSRTPAVVTKSDVASQTYDGLMEKLFGGIRATADNPEVERTVTITVKDKYVPTK